MLEIDVKINGRIIGFARAGNASDLAPVSDYHVVAGSDASPLTGAPADRGEFRVVGHDRVQSAWALVAKIATEMASRDAERALASRTETDRG